MRTMTCRRCRNSRRTSGGFGRWHRLRCYVEKMRKEPMEQWKLFKVIDRKTGKEANPYHIALNPHHCKRHEWASGLVYCDLEGWLINDIGELYLADECGNFEFAPIEQYEVVFNTDWRP